MAPRDEIDEPRQSLLGVRLRRWVSRVVGGAVLVAVVALVLEFLNIRLPVLHELAIWLLQRIGTG